MKLWDWAGEAGGAALSSRRGFRVLVQIGDVEAGAHHLMDITGWASRVLGSTVSDESGLALSPAPALMQ